MDERNYIRLFGHKLAVPHARASTPQGDYPDRVIRQWRAGREVSRCEDGYNGDNDGGNTSGNATSSSGTTPRTNASVTDPNRNTTSRTGDRPASTSAQDASTPLGTHGNSRSLTSVRGEGEHTVPQQADGRALLVRPRSHPPKTKDGASIVEKREATAPTSSATPAASNVIDPRPFS